MSNRIIIACIWWIMILAAMVMTGCSQEQVAAQRSAEFRGGNGDVLRDGFRIRRDMARNRIWLLGLDDVRVYDAGSKRLIRKVALPGWSMARFTCAPDMVLDGSGSAIVSSNVLARFWRIDADSFEAQAHDIRLEGREQWDVGFGALAVAGDESLYALTATGGSLWKIDIARASASLIELEGPPLRGCAFTPQFLKDFERSRKPWTRPSLQRN